MSGTTYNESTSTCAVEGAAESQALHKAAAVGWKPAFQHRVTKDIVVIPGFHNTDLLPGGEFTDDWVDGFVDPSGRFYDREATARALGITDSFQLPEYQNRDLVAEFAADEPSEDADLNKASKSWRSKDGITIPAHGTPERAEWDQRYHQQLVQVFAQGNPKALKPLTINPNDASISGVNMAVNKDRLSLYRRMARAGDPLPPVVVRRSGQGWVLVDGNHRLEAARQAGMGKLSAYEIVPLEAPPTKPFKKAVLDPAPGYGIDHAIAKTKARIAYMRKLAKAPKPSTWPCRGGGHVVVSQDPSKPGRWRVTRISTAGELLWHSEAESHYEALEAARYYGAVIEPPDSVQRFEQDLEQWLAKAMQPEHFKSITKAISPEGRRYVDHTPHMFMHPPAINHEVEYYRNEVFHGPKLFRPQKGDRGVTRKLVYTIKHEPQGDLFAPSRSTMDTRYMVKPYHEGLVKRIQGWQKYLIQGWAEMTNQALYHAAGIGHLHQKVHVSEHNMGAGFEREPALVIHMQPGFKTLDQAARTVHVGGGVYADEPITPTENAKRQARQIALMDFLTNNLDRHAGNLLISEDGENLLAIDHSRSFQYFNTHQYKWDSRRQTSTIRNMTDKFGPYFGLTSAVGNIDLQHHVGYDRAVKRLKDYSPIFDWWGKHSEKVKAAFEQHLPLIKDEKVRAHVRRNFMERARWLDERARMGLENFGVDWHRDEVPQYRDHELTDEEKEQAEIARLRAKYEAEQKVKAGETDYASNR